MEGECDNGQDEQREREARRIDRKNEQCWRPRMGGRKTEG